MLALREAVPKARDLARAEFATLRLRLVKIAARVIETAGRVRLAFAAGCPEAALFSAPTPSRPKGLERRGHAPPPATAPPTRLHHVPDFKRPNRRTRSRDQTKRKTQKPEGAQPGE